MEYGGCIDGIKFRLAARRGEGCEFLPRPGLLISRERPSIRDEPIVKLPVPSINRVYECLKLDGIRERERERARARERERESERERERKRETERQRYGRWKGYECVGGMIRCESKKKARALRAEQVCVQARV